jgi:hypothetical protein
MSQGMQDYSGYGPAPAGPAYSQANNAATNWPAQPPATNTAPRPVLNTSIGITDKIVMWTIGIAAGSALMLLLITTSTTASKGGINLHYWIFGWFAALLFSAGMEFAEALRPDRYGSQASSRVWIAIALLVAAILLLIFTPEVASFVTHAAVTTTGGTPGPK